MAENRSAYTPIPTSDFDHVTKAVTEINQVVKTIKNDLLPPVAVDAKRACEGMIQLQTLSTEVARRVSVLEAIPEHECTETARQMNQDTSIADLRPRVSGLERWKWWLMGLIVMIGGVAGGFAAKSYYTAGSNEATLKNYGEIINRHENKIPSAINTSKEIDELTRIIREDREDRLRRRNTVELPSNYIGIDENSLSDAERRQLQRFLERSKARMVRADD